MRMLSLAVLALVAACGPALAQETRVRIDRGLTEDPPYTLIYPEDMLVVDDGSPVTIVTLQHATATLQCDAMVADGAPDGWTPEGALARFDKAGTEAAWVPDFPGFAVTGQRLGSFQSGPALIYEGGGPNSPLGVPVRIVHAEAVDAGRTFILECIAAADIAEDAMPLIDFLIANFSTRSDGQCCVEPTTR